MSTITLRSTKGSPLTNSEVDGNFTALNTDKLESVSITATASGALANGDLVVVNSDGTVSVVSGSLTSESTGSDAGPFSNCVAGFVSAIYDPDNQKVLVAHRHGTGDGNASKAVITVGTISSGAITFGSAQDFHTAEECHSVALAYDTDKDKLVVFWCDAGSGGSTGPLNVVVGDVASSGTITFGTASEIDADNCGINTSQAAFYDSTSNAVVLAYTNYADNEATLVAGNVASSGNSITMGTPQQPNLGYGNSLAFGYHAAEEIFVLFTGDLSDTTAGNRKIVGASISGTTFTFGSIVDGISSVVPITIAQESITYDSTNENLVIFYSNYTEGELKGRIIGVSGTTLTLGSEFDIATGAAGTGLYAHPAFHVAADSIVIPAYTAIYSSSYDGTEYSWTSTALPESDASRAFIGTPAYDANDQTLLIPFQDTDNNSYGSAFTYSPAIDTRNLTAENFVGISDGAYSDGTTATIQIAGSVDDAQTGLTAGQEYFVQNDNTLALTPDSPNVYAGKAISATEILIGHNRQITTFADDITITGDVAVTGDVNVTGNLEADAFVGTVNATYPVSGTATINCSSGNYYTLLMEANTTLAFSNVPSGGFRLMLRLTHQTTNYTLSYPSSVKWPSNTEPTLSTGNQKVDVLVFETFDGGTNWFGSTYGLDLS